MNISPAKRRLPLLFERAKMRGGLAALFLTGSMRADSAQLPMENFGVLPNTGKDATASVRKAIEHLRGNPGTLVFAPGRYDFWPDRAMEKNLFVSNNDEGLKRIAFPLIGLDRAQIDGRGAQFIFHGPMVPFLVENSKEITIKNLSFDFARPFHSEGRVLAVTANHVDLEISEEFPYEIRNGVLIFNGKKSDPALTTVKSGEVLYPYGSLLAFDAKRRETAFMARDFYGVSEGIAAVEIGPRQVRLMASKVAAEPGNILVFGAAWRAYPGIVVSDSSRVHLNHVDLFHCGGMGVIAQRSADLFLDHVRVTPPPGGGRIISITADATHFVNCRGRIEMTNCLFENQKDDATNIHGLYAQITKKFGPNQFEVRLVHPQQAGVDFIKPGTRLELTGGPSLQTLGEAVVESVERLNKEYTRVVTEKPLPVTVQIGDAVADADANTAEVLIKNCVIRNNRARGILLGSRGKTIVEDNTFHTPGAAILFEGDARYWFEQAGVRDVIIRRNIFDNCNFGVWGKSCIEVGSGIEEKARKTSRYNRNITIEDNLFRLFSPLPVLSIYSVDRLNFRQNRFEESIAYPGSPAKGDALFAVTDSNNILIEEIQKGTTKP